MNELDVSFEPAPWELALSKLRPGSVIGALRFLTLTEGEDEDTFEAALQALEEGKIGLNIADLPACAGGGEVALRLRQEAQLAGKEDWIPSLEEGDPLRLYLEEIARLPRNFDVQGLEEKVLAGDLQACEAAANALLPMVVEEARKLTGRGVLLLDLIQEGSLGLWQAMQNPVMPLNDHILWWIRQYMAKLVVSQARADGVGNRLRKSMEDYRKMDQTLLYRLGRNPQPEEIADAMGITAEEGARIADMLQSANQLAKDKKTEPEQETGQDEAVEDTAYFQMRQRIEELLSGLDEQSARILTLRFGLEGGLPMSPADAGRKLGLTPDEVLEREAAALAKLRNNG